MTIATLLGCLLPVGCMYPRASTPPMWRLADAAAERVGCAEVDAWVVKSGRAGVGVTVQLRAVDHPCAIRVERAVIVPATKAEHPTARLPSGTISVGHDPVYLYLPFAFDNLGTWKRGGRHGDLLLTVRAAVTVPDVPRSPATTLSRQMFQWPGPTWDVDYWAYERVAANPRETTTQAGQASALYYLKASCAWVGWVGSDGTDSRFQAVIGLVPDEPSCSLSVHAAALLENGVRIAAADLPKQFTLAKGRKDHLLLDFSLPSGPPSPYRVLYVEVQDAAGGRFPLEWPLFRVNPFLDELDAPRRARGFDERGLLP